MEEKIEGQGTGQELTELEEALRRAAQNPEHIQTFYQMLMNSTVYVVGKREEPDGEEEAGEQPHIHLKQWQQPDGGMALPFFATPECLQKTLGPDEPFLPFWARDLFRMSNGTTLVFTTPEGAKAFKQDEVAAILSMVFSLDPLTVALAKAVEENTDEARRSFYNVLINSQVFVIGHPVDDSGNRLNEDGKPAQGERTLTSDDKFRILSAPHPHVKDQKVIPFFSSIEHLGLVSPQGQPFMRFAALPFLSMAKDMGQPLVLNPGSSVYKFLTESEVDFLLNSAKPDPFESRHFQPGTKIFLSQPEKYPQELVRDLLDFLPTQPAVSAAYLVAMREESEEAAPILVIGFQADGDLENLFRSAEELVSKHANDDFAAIDFARVVPGEKGISQYFSEKGSPFYLKAKGGAVPEAGGEKAQAAKEQYDKPGFFGRLKRIFSNENKA